MRQTFTFSLFVGLFVPFLALKASPTYDQQYGFKNVVVTVLSQNIEPVHSTQVELELTEQVQKRPRFQYQEKVSLDLKQKIQALIGSENPVNLTENFEVLKPTLQTLKNQGIDAAILAEVIRREGHFDLALALVAVDPGEVMAQAVQKIEPPFSESQFRQKTEAAFLEMIRNIPFDGSVLKRDGYLVVLDGGTGIFSPGMRLPTFTVEKVDGKLIFNETGQILVQKAEESISFGKILVENKPLEVLTGNKIRLGERLSSQEIPELMQSLTDAGRTPASQITSDFEVSKGEIGKVALNFGMDMVEFANKVNQEVVDNSSVFFPGAQIEGELWFTNRWYMESSMGLSMGNYANTVGEPNTVQSSSLSSFRLQFGYRMNVLAPERGPVVYTKLGYGKQAYDLGIQEPIKFTSVVYGGILLTGGVRFPVEENINVGAEINTLVFASMAETPVSSGSEKMNVNAWDFALKGSYSWSSQLDVEGRVIFRNSGAEFGGDSDRPDPISQFTQSSKVIQLGLSYYF